MRQGAIFSAVLHLTVFVMLFFGLPSMAPDALLAPEIPIEIITFPEPSEPLPEKPSPNRSRNPSPSLRRSRRPSPSRSLNTSRPRPSPR
jgi:hypothetical protein